MFLINLFYTSQEINKILIRKSYNEYRRGINEFNIYFHTKNNQCRFGEITIEEYNNFTDKDLKKWMEYQDKINKLKNICINNLLTYCKNYHDEKISKNQFICDYNVDHSYRLEQNIDEVILDL